MCSGESANGRTKDTQPPKLIEAVPLNASVNFTAKTIEFKFDEFVQVKIWLIN